MHKKADTRLVGLSALSVSAVLHVIGDTMPGDIKYESFGENNMLGSINRITPLIVTIQIKVESYRICQIVSPENKVNSLSRSPNLESPIAYFELISYLPPQSYYIF